MSQYPEEKPPEDATSLLTQHVVTLMASKVGRSAENMNDRYHQSLAEMLGYPIESVHELVADLTEFTMHEAYERGPDEVGQVLTNALANALYMGALLHEQTLETT